MTELRELRYFVAVVDEGQVSRAAAKLHIAQPALSQAIRKLEESYGVMLLERHARGVSPTAEGLQVVAKARAVLAQADELDVLVRGWDHQETSQVVIGALPLSLSAVNPLVQAVGQRNPEIAVSYHQLDFVTQRASLRRGVIDAEIACPATIADEFIGIEFAHTGRVAWLSDRHQLAERDALTMADICDLPVVRRHPDVPEDWWEAMLSNPHRTGPMVMKGAAARTPEELWPAVSSGEAISISPGFVGRVAPTYVGRGHFPGLVSIPIVDAEPLAIALLYRRDDHRWPVKALAAAASQIAKGRANLML